MAAEKYIAAAGLALFIMFVGEIVTLYDFMINDLREIEPSPKVLQFISIGVAPGLIMVGVSYLMSKRYGSKPIGYMIMAGGLILLAGMAYSYTLLDKLDEKYLQQAVIITPPLFMAVSVPVILIGAKLLKTKKRRPRKEYV